MEMQIDHFVVAPSGIGDDALKYRRHRLVEKLLGDPDTGKVFWISPIETGNKGELFRKEKRWRRVDQSEKLVELKINDYKNIITLQSGMALSTFNKIVKEVSRAEKRILWFTYPGFSDLAAAAKWNRIVYDCSDSWGSTWVQPRGLKRVKPAVLKKMIQLSERRVAKSSAVRFASSQFLGDKIERITGEPAAIIENGVEYNDFANAATAELAEIPSPRFGFIGGIKSKLDFELLYELAITAPSVQLVLVGPAAKEKNESLDKLLSLRNVHSLGGVKYTKVPEYIKAMDVGLLPYKKIEYNQAVSPLKMFEYLAAGIPVVGIGVPTTEKYQQAGVYSYAKSDLEFISECLKSIKLRNSDSLIQERQKTAKQQDWDEKLSLMIHLAKDPLYEENANLLNNLNY
ncbi:glycosyltransferase [Planococcus massiliensis]|nr:glycosyltransferase [Planococcus massiliensis]